MQKYRRLPRLNGDVAEVNLDWHPVSLEGKCNKETLKIIEKTVIKWFSDNCVQIWKKVHLSQESHPEKGTKNVNLMNYFDEVPNS